MTRDLTKGQETVTVTKTSLDAARIIRAGMENLLDSGCSLTAYPLEPTVSRSLQAIRAARQDNWIRHQAQMQRLKEQIQARKVDTYLHHAIKIYADKHPAQRAAVAGELRANVSPNRLADVFPSKKGIPPPKRRRRVS